MERAAKIARKDGCKLNVVFEQDAGINQIILGYFDNLKADGLGVKHARYEKSDGDKKTVVEYNFDEAEINKASINMDQALVLPAPKDDVEPTESGIRKEVMLFLEQANRGPGKEKGRTGDRGRIPEISDKVLPVYFRQSIQDLKEKMMQGEENPLNLVFVVDVHIQRIDGEPKGFTVVDIHESTERDD